MRQSLPARTKTPIASVSDARRQEVAQLLSAFVALHRDGMLGDHEYEAKCSALVAGPTADLAGAQ